jgi:hypothetical protein
VNYDTAFKKQDLITLGRLRSCYLQFTAELPPPHRHCEEKAICQDIIRYAVEGPRESNDYPKNQYRRPLFSFRYHYGRQSSEFSSGDEGNKTCENVAPIPPRVHVYDK